MHQFARFARPCRRTIVAHHQDFGKGHRVADRGRMRIDQRGVAIRRPKRFGQAVHRIQIRGGRQIAQPPHQRHIERTAAVGQPPQPTRPFTHRQVTRNQLAPQRRNPGQRGNRMPFDRTQDIARHQIVMRHHTSARIPCRQHLILPIIKRQRQHRQHTIVRRQPHILRHTLRAEPQVRMADHHALGQSGRTAGIQQRDHVIDRCLRCGQGIAAIQRRQNLCIIDAPTRARIVPAPKIVAAQSGGTRRIDDQQRGTTISQDMRDLPAFQHRVDRYMDQRRTRARQRQQAGHFAFWQPACNTAAGCNLACQPGTKLAYTPI